MSLAYLLLLLFFFQTFNLIFSLFFFFSFSLDKKYILLWCPPLAWFVGFTECGIIDCLTAVYPFCFRIQVPYRLHAVLVHEGQANAGHYWAYIFDHRENRWMKYNDIAVTKSSWEELVRDSFGGYRNASAYCLMYINDKAQFLIQGKNIKYIGWCIFLNK